jgi:arylsulfatase A-like enzyme
MENDRFLDRNTELPKPFYSTKVYTDKMLELFESRDETEREKPFLAYLAYTAPHWPLQAPQEDIDRYKGMYDDGPDALRLRRLKALKERGLVPEDVEPAPVIGEMLAEWGDMTTDEKAHSSRRMETYAAMVDLIDRNLSRVVSHLETTGELDNTFILFMSDNGAEGKLLEALPVMAGVPLVQAIKKFYDNSLSNIGKANSFVWYGPRWAAAATAPSRGYKTWITEGGIRCPCIIRYPPFAHTPGSITHEFTTVMDLLPTILDMAGISHPGTRFRGRDVVLPRGRSWAPYLFGQAHKVHPNGQDVTGWELFGRRAIRRGDWKAIYIPAPLGSDEWELFDLSNDQGEVHDLAKECPDVLNELLVEWEKYFAETGMYDPWAEGE